MPDVIQKIPINVFLLALLWTACGAATPIWNACIAWALGAAKPDWQALRVQVIGTALVAVVAFWRKYKAYLALPPTLQEVKALVTTTAQVTEQTGPATVKVTTVSETHSEPLVKE